MMVAPWLESAAWLGNVSHLVKGDHVAPPRVFKSHLPFGVSRVARAVCGTQTTVSMLTCFRGYHRVTADLLLWSWAGPG